MPTFDDIVERFAVIGEEDTIQQKIGVAIFGGISLIACAIICVFYRLKYGEAISADPEDYHCRDDVQDDYILAMRVNWILYLILSVLSILSIVAGPVVKVRAVKGCLTTVLGFAHLGILIWTAVIRFDEDGELCMIMAEDPLLKEHAKFLKIMIIVQFNLYCPLYLCQNAGLKKIISTNHFESKLPR